MESVMDLAPDILRTFTAAAQTQNFTQAAQKVNITQSAVSHQIRKLESNLGRTLFERVPHGVKLTRHGESLLKYANRLLRLHNEALAIFAESSIKGRIRLGATEEYAALYLPGILKRFDEKYLLVQVDIYCDRSKELLKMMDQGKMDLCLRNSQAIESKAEFLRKELLIWVGPKDANPENESPVPIAVFNKGCMHRQWAIEALEKNDIDYRIAYSSPSISGILAAVRSGLAVAPIGASTFISDLRMIPQKILPALPSAMICLYQSKCHGDGIQNSSVKHIIDEFCNIPVYGQDGQSCQRP
jgi:DNA-binding transcriptional LysR family regulator